MLSKLHLRYDVLSCTASFAALSVALASPATAQVAVPVGAQSAATDAESPAPAGDIVVTGTRIARDGASSPTPLTVLGGDYLAARATSNVADALNELPSFRATTSSASTSSTATQAGTNFLDLRGLGSNRTLLLVDGKRHVSTAITGQVDINMIPTLLIDRVEVVTGGASAVYGSDAVAGVVNLIYKKNFTGLEGDAQYDVAQVGDAQGYRFALHGGTAFLEDRLHVSGAVEVFHNDGIGSMYTRDWGRREYGILTNPARATNGLPVRIISDHVRTSTMTPYGLVTSGLTYGDLTGTTDARRIQFAADGTPVPFNQGTLAGSQYMIGGDGAGQGFLSDFSLAPRISRQLASGDIHYDAGDGLEFGTAFYYARSRASGQAIAPFDFGTLTIQRDNAYLPAALAAAMDAKGLTKLAFGRLSLDVGPNTSDNTTQTYRSVTDAKGRIGAWKWDAYYQYGKTDYVGRFNGVRNNARYLAAIDSVIDPATGKAVCRSTLTAPGNGCIAYNPFGDTNSTAAKEYVTGDQYYHLVTQQHVAAVNFTGPVAELWAGPLAASLGAEYRHEQASATADAASIAGAYAAGNYKPIDGRYSVREAYLEMELPVVRDLPFAKAIDLNGAVRYADYSTSGGYVTWKLGGTWDIGSGLMVRATRSRDIRAPNISELYASSVTRITSVTDPQNGNASIFIPTLTSGSTALKPEKANTFTAGVTYAPTWINGVQLSVDYYDIKINDAITSLTAQNIVDRCYAGDQSLCGLVVRSGGTISQININQINLASFATAGVDFELSYSTDLLGGRFSWRNLLTYVDKFEQSNGAVVTNLANQFNGAGVARWTGNSTIAYQHGRVGGSLVGRFVGAGKYDNLFVEGVDINDNTVSSRFYLNLNLRYDLTDDGSVQIYGVVNNLLDTDPSIAPQTTTVTNVAYFDEVGRAFRVGAKFKF
ncbi:TonB-dependent receptor plug domain-containing protein [Novosphingobium sp. 11B]